MTILQRKPCIIANWKMNGSQAANRSLVDALIAGVATIESLNEVDIFLSPPAVYLAQVSELIHGGPFQLAAQNVNEAQAGPYTGEIAAPMLVDIGCKAVIIGHSERRHGLGETNEWIARKFLAAYHAGLIPILCVGETSQERESGKTLEIVGHQLRAVLALVKVQVFETAMIAYEPVWAIGTGKAASPADAQEVQAFIRGLLAEEDLGTAQKTRILYGGSLNSKIAKDLFTMPDVDGGLVGGASLVAEDFLGICKAVTLRVKEIS